MKKNIRSHSTQTSNPGRAFWLPDWLQLLLYFFISFLILVALNFRALWDHLNRDTLASTSENASGLQSWLAGSSQTRILQFVFWMFIGCTVYVFIWFIGSVFTNIYNDVVVDEYVHPKTFNRKRYWQSVLFRKLFWITSLVTLMAFILTSIKLMPQLGNLAFRGVQDFNWRDSSLELLGALAATTGIIYLFVLLVHICLNSWRAINRDL